MVSTRETERPFIVVSGLPGSGKSSLAKRLSALLNLPVIDKDDILERLFDSKGVGDSAQRRLVSRESDSILRDEATASRGAILVSFWHVPGMPADSGTPTDWLLRLSHHVVNIHCACSPEVAAARFCQRKRHPGHLDSERSATQVLESIRLLAHLEPPDIWRRVEVDTSAEIDLDAVIDGILKQLGDQRRCR